MKINSIVSFLCFYAGLFPALAQTNTKVPVPTSNAVSTRNAINLNTIDPAVVDITFTTVKQNSGDKMRVCGLIKNLGGKNFESGENQQLIQLWEVRSSSDKQKLKEIRFNRLNSGQEIGICHELPALKPGKEFPPDYQVIIVYDPDILSDANKNNDDARSNNNSMTKNPRK